MENLHKIFGENLKRNRIMAGLTQKELAEKICYSEKSVSKWESGNGLPGIEILIDLCKALHIRIDELIYQYADTEYFLGIDGGGTKSHFILEDSLGNKIKEVIKGASNPNDIGLENAKIILKEGIIEICNGYPYSKISMFAGIAGSSSGHNKETLTKCIQKFGFKSAKVGSDVENSIALGLNENNGMVVVMGTGIATFVVKNNERYQIGGWGQLFDAGGSGYNLGKDAIYAALREGDGTGEKTLLTPMLEKRMGDTAKNCLGDIYVKGKSYIASFSDVVFDAAKQNDLVANEILKANLREVAKMICAGAKILDQKTIKVAFSGGIVEKSEVVYPMIRQYLDDKYTYLFETITKSPVYGALIIAKRRNKDA